MRIAQLRPFQHLEWHPGRGELRRFAVGMLVGFALVGALAAVRRHGVGTASLVFWGLGVALALGALVPGLGRAVYLAVYLPTSVVGFVVSHIVLTLIFFLVFTPLAVTLRLMGHDLLRLRPGRQGAQWLPRSGDRSRDSYYRQF